VSAPRSKRSGASAKATPELELREEIEITPAMIQAGVKALVRYDHEIFDARVSSEAERLAVEVFEAMVGARQRKIG
jgi:hypothetical protein